MTTAENKEKVRATFATNDQNKNMEALRSWASPDYVAHFPGMPPVNAEAMAGIGAAFYSAFPDMTHTLHEVIGEEDIVAARTTITGTHDAPFQTPQGELPASGRPMTLEVLHMFRIGDDGRPVEQWINFDLMGFMQQIAPAQ
jgi:predicted ester cyclase